MPKASNLGFGIPTTELRARARREALMAMATGAMAEPVAGIAGLWGAMTGGVDKGVQNIEATRKALTYAPRDASALNALGSALEPVTRRVEQARTFLGGKAMDRTGSPALATAAYMIPDMAMTLMGARGAGVKGPTMTQMAQRSQMPTSGSAAAQRGAIGAWHGSPHDFDQFDMSKLGTGEGAQAYGHGLYFAGNRGVAEGYQKALAGDGFKAGDGEMFYPSSLRHLNVRVKAARGDFQGAIDAAAALEKSDSPVAYLAQSDRLTLEELMAKGEIKPNEGRLYDVELSPDEGDLLDWDAPLSGQPEKVREPLGRLVVGDSTFPDGSPIPASSHNNTKAAALYETLVERLGSAQAASNAMRQAGIPGIRYLDGGSRDAGDGSRNYVMFDDKLVKIRGKQ